MKTLTYRLAALAICFFAFSQICFTQTTYYVKTNGDDSKDGLSWTNAVQTLQKALDLATSIGDEIWIARGTYVPSFGFDPEDSRSKIFYVSQDIKIIGGFAGNEPVGYDLSQRNFTDNETILSGDLNGDDGTEFANYNDNCYAVVLTNGSPMLMLNGLTIYGANSEGSSSFFGGIHNENSAPTISNCTIRGNMSPLGGGMYNFESSPIISNCTFIENSAEIGGGMYNYESSPTVNQCIFKENLSTQGGGGMLNVSFSSPMVSNCTFIGNTGIGSGMVNYQSSSPAVTNCIFRENIVGIWNDESSPVVTNCTFYENAAGIDNNSSDPIITNCLIFGYSTINDDNDSNPVVSYCIMNGGYSGGTNIIDGYPDFVSATDLHLEFCSPAVDAGTNTGVPTTDLDGNTRPYNSGTADMGAFEFQGSNPILEADCKNRTVILDKDGNQSIAAWALDNYSTGCNLTFKADGQSTLNYDCTDLSSSPIAVTLTVIDDFGAEDDCSANITIEPYITDILYVNPDADGNENGSSWANAYTELRDALNSCAVYSEIWVAKGIYKPTSGASRSVYFVMKEGVKIYGGLAGTEAVGYDMSLRDFTANETTLSGNIGTISSSSDNSYHVVYTDGLDETAVLDGFTITGGNANGSSSHDKRGGGMYNRNSSSPTVANCTFSGNSANFGGGMYNLDSSPEVTNCLFSSNSALELGGGMNNNGSPAKLNNCIFDKNTAGGKGGGINNFFSSLKIINCTFYSNTAENNGNAMYSQSSSPTITNCIFRGSNNPIENGTTGNPTVTYSIVQGGYTGTGNLNTNPLFVDAANGNFHLEPCSRAIDTGTNTNAPSNDFDGNARPLTGTKVDMGAYEFQRGASNMTNACDLGSRDARIEIHRSNGTGSYDNNWTASPGYDLFYQITLTNISYTTHPNSLGVAIEQADFDAVLYFLDSDGNQIATNNGAGNLAKVTLNDLGAGTYFIVVDGHTVNDFGHFDLWVGVGDAITAEYVLNPSIGCAVPHLVFFTDQSTRPDTWDWSFGDGHSSTLQNPVHSYTTTGTFQVELTVSDTFSMHSISKPATVIVSTPEADFSGKSLYAMEETIPPFGCGPLSVDFIDASANTVSWSWDFGDGQTSSEQNPTHIYNTPGSYSVALTITDSHGCKNTLTKTNYVQVVGPNVDFSADPTISCEGESINFEDLTIHANPPVFYEWNFGDATSSNAFGSVTHSYLESDVYDVSLKVIDLIGCERTLLLEDYITIDQMPPLAKCKEHTVLLNVDGNGSLTANDIDDGSSDNCKIASLSASPNAFTCANVGANTVTLTVTDNGGNVKTCTSTVTVEDNEKPDALCKTHTVQLDADGNGSLSTNDIDDSSSDACGIKSLSASPNTFDCGNVGANTVTLTVTDDNDNVKNMHRKRNRQGQRKT